jgi:hypothetical protein
VVRPVHLVQHVYDALLDDAEVQHHVLGVDVRVVAEELEDRGIVAARRVEERLDTSQQTIQHRVALRTETTFQIFFFFSLSTLTNYHRKLLPLNNDSG